MELSREERAILRDLAEWALDQEHMAAGLGDPEFLYFLVDSDDPDSTLESVKGMIESAYAKLIAG